jgi:hypothetical protein
MGPAGAESLGRRPRWAEPWGAESLGIAGRTGWGGGGVVGPPTALAETVRVGVVGPPTESGVGGADVGRGGDGRHSGRVGAEPVRVGVGRAANRNGAGTAAESVRGGVGGGQSGRGELVWVGVGWAVNRIGTEAEPVRSGVRGGESGRAVRGGVVEGLLPGRAVVPSDSPDLYDGVVRDWRGVGVAIRRLCGGGLPGVRCWRWSGGGSPRARGAPRGCRGSAALPTGLRTGVWRPPGGRPG